MTASIEAERCYQAGCSLFDSKHFLDAQVQFDRAARLAPDNPLYADARERLRDTVRTFGAPFSGQTPFPSGKPSFWARCGDGGCECCGEICCEGLCEALCENCECDCDCS